MARAHHVKRAQKDYPDHGIKKGEPYWWWKFMQGGRGGPKHYSKTAPRGSQLTQSEFLSAFYALEEELQDLKADDGLESEVSEIAGRFRELGEEQDGKKDNLPDGLQNGAPGELLGQRSERCGEIADELEALTFDVKDKEKDESEEDFWQAKLDEVQAVDMTVE